MVCSVYFSQYLFEALYRAGRGEAALKLMTAEDDRSWIGMMKQGATITMEAWNRKVKPNLDWNHAWGATPLNAVSRFLLGVEPIEPGFKKISIRPQIGWLKNVEAKVPTVMGPVLIRISPDRLEFDSPAPVEAAFAGVTGEFPSGRHEIVPQLRQAESP